jgi:hypothetical protein
MEFRRQRHAPRTVDRGWLLFKRMSERNK